VIRDQNRFFIAVAHEMRASECAQSIKRSRIKPDKIDKFHAQLRLGACLVDMLATWTAAANKGEIDRGWHHEAATSKTHSIAWNWRGRARRNMMRGWVRWWADLPWPLIW